MKKIFFSVIVMFLTVSAIAADISGKVVNKETATPISNVIILLSIDGEVVESTISDFSGHFSIQLKVDESYRIEAMKDGYKAEFSDFEVTQGFLDISPEVVIKMSALKFEPTFEEMADGMENRLDEDIMEDIGSVDNLPEGYKIIEAVPLKTQEVKRSGFNVNSSQSYTYTNVNVKVLKEAFNHENLHELAYAEEGLLPTSYYVEGDIMFGAGKALLSDDVEEVLLSIAEKLKAEPSTKLRMTAYADGEREAEVGDLIAKMRAEEVTNFLLTQEVPFGQLEIVITGNKFLENGCYPKVDCEEYNHQENRRVVLELVK